VPSEIIVQVPEKVIKAESNEEEGDCQTKTVQELVNHTRSLVVARFVKHICSLSTHLHPLPPRGYGNPPEKIKDNASKQKVLSLRRRMFRRPKSGFKSDRKTAEIAQGNAGSWIIKAGIDLDKIPGCRGVPRQGKWGQM
jgi:hypothetical protein